MKKLYITTIRLAICIGKFLLNILYFFLKLFPSRNKIVMLSRQSNKVSIDFQYIKEEITKRNCNVEIKLLCKILHKSPIERIKYCFYIIKCMYHIATSKVCVVDGYSIPISILKHKKNLEIIQIWHASGAIKKFGYQALSKKEGRGTDIAKIMKMHKNYSHVLAPSKATAKFYVDAFGINIEQIIINGLPRLDYILSTNNKTLNFLQEYPDYADKKTILYVPTFRKDSDSFDAVKSLEKCINFSKYNLIVKAHPLDKKDVSKYTVDKKYNTYDLLKIADYIITDYSAVAFEASILDKPIYFYLYDIDNYKKVRGLNINLFNEMSNCTSKSAEIIMSLIENETYDFNQLKKFKFKYMGNDYFNNTEKLVDFIFSFLDGDIKNEKNKNNINEHSKEKLNV